VALAALLSSLMGTLPACAQSLSQAGTSAAPPLSQQPELVTLDADSTSLTSILKMLASRSGLNIVTSPKVQGRRITIHLRNTPLDDALNLIVRAAGLGYERVGNSILISDMEGLQSPAGFATRVYDLHHADAATTRTMLQVLGAEVAADPVGQRLTVRASPSVLEQASALIAELDRRPPQVLLEARLIEVNTTELLEVGIDWERLMRWSTVITEGRPDPSRQGELPDDLDYVEIDKSGDYHRQVAAFRVAIEALLTDGSARLLSNANVVTLAGRPAEIFAGETVPVVITSLQNPGSSGVLQTVQIEKIDVGVKLSILPRVSGDGYITTLVEPEISRIIRFVGPDSDLPQTSTRRASTLVRVRDGEKIFLGGLLSDEKRSTVKKVPLLGQIPLLGHLFSHRRDETDRLDLVIEITPRVVGDESATVPQAPEIPGRRQ